jgi:hypothetical protein
MGRRASLQWTDDLLAEERTDRPIHRCLAGESRFHRVNSVVSGEAAGGAEF